MRFSYGTIEEEKGVTSMALTELYSELIARGYIRAADSRALPLGRAYPSSDSPYLITHAGLDHERFLRTKHSLASRRVVEEVRKDPRSNDLHIAFLGALTIHDQGCPGCLAETLEHPPLTQPSGD